MAWKSVSENTILQKQDHRDPTKTRSAAVILGATPGADRCALADGGESCVQFTAHSVGNGAVRALRAALTTCRRSAHSGRSTRTTRSSGCGSWTRAQAIRFYTINNARILFLEDRIGSLEEGTQADFVVIDRNS
jgi:hypothetical protein